MRTVLYKKRNSLKNRRKVMSICERTQEKDCKTNVRKHFVYVATKVDKADKEINPPRIDITKSINTKKREEKFHFRVKGYFYMVRDKQIFKVDFCHSLNISILWKKNFSPKKSATLT